MSRNSKKLNQANQMVRTMPRSRSRPHEVSKSRSHSVPPSPLFRFQFGDQNITDLNSFGPEQEIKYLRIALAARQSFLKELRHRVHVSITKLKYFMHFIRNWRIRFVIPSICLQLRKLTRFSLVIMLKPLLRQMERVTKFVKNFWTPTKDL